MKEFKDISNYIIDFRKNKNKSIEEASSILKIKKNLLLLIENGNFDIILDDVYTKGHMRTYLEWLEIDADRIFSILKDTKTIKIYEKEKNFYIPNLYIKKIHITIICVIILCVVIYSWNKLYLEEINTQVLKEEKDMDSEENNSRNDQLVEAIISNKNEILNKLKDSIVYLEATSVSWVQIERLDGSIYTSKILKEGDKIKISGEKNLTLITNNAGGIVIKVDKTIIKSLGEVGTIKRDISLNPDDLLKMKNK